MLREALDVALVTAAVSETVMVGMPGAALIGASTALVAALLVVPTFQ